MPRSLTYGMKHMIKRILLAFAILLGLGFGLAPASHAQATRTWVSGIGDDANPCSRTAPCKTFAGAISKTAAGGEINCIDPGGFGTLTITKAITLNCEGTLGSILASSTTGILINTGTTAGGTNVVTINGLEIDGAGNGAVTGIDGIKILSVDQVILHRVQVRDFLQSCVEYNGSLANLLLSVSDSYFSNCGSGAVAGDNAGINIVPTGGNANVNLTGVRLNGNAIGLNIDSSSTTGSMRVSLTDSTISGSVGAGAKVTGNNTGKIRLFVDKSLLTNNGTGEKVAGSNAAILTYGSVIYGNNVGIQGDGLGQLDSYGNNALNGNLTSDGAFNTPLISQQ